MNGDLAYIHEFAVNTEAPLRVLPLQDAMPTGDSHAHVFRLRLPGTMPESAAAYAVRPDGVTVVIPCELVTGTISFSLPPEALSVAGRVELLVRGMAGDRVTTLLWCCYTARPGATARLLDPANFVPSLQALLAKIDACEAAADRADTAADDAEQALSGLTQGMEDAVSPLRQRIRAAEDRLDNCEAGMMDLEDSMEDMDDSLADTTAIALANRTRLQLAQNRLTAQEDALSAQTLRLTQAETGIAGAQTCLGSHGTRLTALEAVTHPDSLAALFCPGFSLSGQVVTCHPAPGTTVHVDTEGADTVWHATGRVLWRCTDFVGSDSNYYVTGGSGGEDILLPPGTWIISWQAEGVPADDGYGVIYRLQGQDSVRVNRKGPEGSMAITLQEASRMSLWFYNSSNGWAQAGRPPMTVMIADAAMSSIGLPPVPVIYQAADSFIAPAAHDPVLVWTEDGSGVTARGYESLPHYLERMAVQ